MLKLFLKHIIYDICIDKLFSNITDKFTNRIPMSQKQIEQMIDNCMNSGYMPKMIIMNNGTHYGKITNLMRSGNAVMFIYKSTKFRQNSESISVLSSPRVVDTKDIFTIKY